MNVDFGAIEKYFPDRGFGFVGHTFMGGQQKSLFFHIKTIKASSPELAAEIVNSFTDSTEAIATPYQSANKSYAARKPKKATSIRFWFEHEDTPKGRQVSGILEAKSVQKRLAENSNTLVEKIENIWKNISINPPDWIHEVTEASLGSDRANELAAVRENLENKQREINERQRAVLEAEQQRKEIEKQEFVEKHLEKQRIEENEFYQLVAETRSKNFSRSKELSSYIVKNKLGHKYKHISGILEMENNDGKWKFNGGFPPAIYRRLCIELGLTNEGSEARPKGFTPYKDLFE